MNFEKICTTRTVSGQNVLSQCYKNICIVDHRDVHVIVDIYKLKKTKHWE